MRKLSTSILALTAVSMSALAPIPQVFAQSQQSHVHFKSQEASTTDGFSVSWDSGADHYAVFDSNTLVYQGKDNSFTLKTNAPHKHYNLQVLAYATDGTVVGKSMVHVTTADKTSAIPNVVYRQDSDGQLSFTADLNGNVVVQHGVAEAPVTTESSDVTDTHASYLNSVVNQDSVSLSWDTTPGLSSYDVYRDGTKIGTTTTGQFTDDSIQSGQNYLYEVKAYRPMDATRTKKNGRLR